LYILEGVQGESRDQWKGNEEGRKAEIGHYHSVGEKFTFLMYHVNKNSNWP